MNEITRWRPFRELAAMQNAMERFFDEAWRPLFDEAGFTLNANMLALDVHEDDQNYTVTTELPGVTAEHIHVKMDGDYLIIEGEMPEQVVEKEGTRTLMRERRYGKYSRRIRLPQAVNADKVEAVFENGVLTLTLPKAEEVKPKMIEVRATKN